MWSVIVWMSDLVSGCVTWSDYSVMVVLVAPCGGEILLGLVGAQLYCEMLAFVVSYPGHATYRRRLLLLERFDPVTILETRVRLKEVEFLGQVVSKSGISVDLSKVEAGRNQERPKNVC